MSKRLQNWLAVAIVLVLFGIVGRMDADEADRQADEYCHNVKSGVWPDYQGNFKEFCNNSEK